VVLEEIDEIRSGRADLHEIRGPPRPTQRHRRLPKEEIDVDGLVRLAGTAFLGLLDEPHDRGEALGERLLVRQGGHGPRWREERERSEQPNQRRASQTSHPSCFDAKRSNPGRRESTGQACGSKVSALTTRREAGAG
jgi:hypothetical protein